MGDICTDNRFELIEKYKKELIESTNIESSLDEMNVLDDLLFRFWQMGWLDRLAQPERKTGKWYKPNGVMPPEHFGRHRCSICDAFAMHDWKHHREQLTDYCPNCGSYMRGDKHETD